MHNEEIQRISGQSSRTDGTCCINDSMYLMGSAITTYKKSLHWLFFFICKMMFDIDILFS